nr:hypothetical protein [Chloroflexia bacterium]
MPIPASPHFTPLSLAPAFNADRRSLGGGLTIRTEPVADWSGTAAFGRQTYRGIPFALGEPGGSNVVVLTPGS